jgi:hypothetical protein
MFLIQAVDGRDAEVWPNGGSRGSRGGSTGYHRRFEAD